MAFRTLSGDEISQIVAASTAGANSRRGQVRAAGNYPKLSSSSKKTPAQKAADAAANLAPDTQDRVKNFSEDQRQRLEVSGFGWLATATDILRAIPGLGANLELTQNVTNDLMAPMPEDETPQNFAQWGLNLLGTGLYAVSRGVEAVGEGAANDRGALETAGNVVGGVGRGVAEGLGFRFDGERPRTMGQNLEDVGANDLIREAAENAGATEDGDGFWNNTNTLVGLAGFTADVASDPLTYVAGTGLVRGAGAATRALGAGVREGVRNPIRLAARASREGWAEQQLAIRELAAARAARKTANAQRRSGAAISTREYEAENGVAAAAAEAREAAAEAAAQAARAADDAARATAEPAVAPESVVDEVIADQPVAEPTPDAAPAEPAVSPTAAFDEAARAMTTLDSQAADPAAVLAQASAGTVERPIELSIVDDLVVGLRGGRPAPVEPGQLDVGLQKPPTKAELAVQVNNAIAELKAAGDAGRAVLRQQLRLVGGKTPNSMVSVEAALRGAVNDADMRTMVADYLEAGARTLDGATVTAPSMGLTREGLGASLVAALGKKKAGKVNTDTLYDELSALETDEQRLQVLGRILSTPGKPLKSFDEAMKAASKSQVGAADMRTMLNLLGVKTTAKTAAGLQKALTGKGAETWKQIKAKIPTEQEVLESHGVTPETAAAADEIDLDAVQVNAAGTAEELSEEILGAPDEAALLFVATDEQIAAADELLGSPAELGEELFASTVTRRAVMEMGKRTRELYPESPMSPKYVEQFNQDEWLIAHRAAMSVARNSANKAQMAGRARGEFLFDRVMDAHRLHTARMLAQGRVPRLQQGFGKDGARPEAPVYLSVDQLLDLLPRELAMRAMFGLDYMFTAPGKGWSDEARKLFEQGISVYPTTIARIARAAMRGTDPGKIAKQFLTGKRNAFEKTDEGQAILREIIDHYSQPGIRAQLKLVHDAQEIVAVAVAKRIVDGVVGGYAQNIIRALGRSAGNGADRSKVLAEIEAATLAAARLADDGAQSLIRDMAQERLGNGVLAMLGEPGTLLARADARMAAARKEAYAPAGSGGRSAAAKEQEKAMREAVGRANTVTIEESDKLAWNAAEARVRDGEFEDTEIGRIEAYDAVMSELGLFQLFGRVGAAFFGKYGMGDLKPMQVMHQSGLYNNTEMFAGMMNRWITGGRIGDTLGAGGKQVDSLATRLQADLGLPKPPTLDELNDIIKSWWLALGRHEEAIERGGGTVTDDALAARLAAGQPRNELVEGMDIEVPPLSQAQVQMAMELREWIRDGFDGPLSRTGLTASDLAKQMEKLGFTAGGDFAGAENFLPGKSLFDQRNLWRQWDMAGIGHPMDALLRVHGSLTRAQVKIDVARSLTSRFGHKFAAGGKSVDELRAEGWKRLDTGQENSFIAAYLDPDMYYPPEILRQLPYLEKFFKQMDNAEVLELGQPFMRNVVRPYDIATGILKSSQTVWNPAHHMTNVIGETFALLLAGVNPAHVVRSFAAMRAGGKLLDADMSPLDMYRQQFGPGRAGDGLGPVQGRAGRWQNGEAGIALADGRVVNLSPQEVWQRALQAGVAVTARHSKDLIPGLSDDATGFASSRWAKFTSNRFNVVARADRRIGEFSAARDNMTRIGHFYAALEEKPFRNVDEAVAYAASRVHDYHPTIQTMSATEQKVARRLVMYYTWVRQMAGRVVSVALERPALVTMPSKFAYNQAEANGLEPESFGKPFPSDPRIASYYKEGLIGPSWFGGYAPFSSPDELPIDPETGEPVTDPQLWGFSFNAPQVDALFTLFGGLNADDTDPLEWADHYTGMLNVFLKIPGELAFNSRIGGIGSAPRDDLGNYLASQTGAPYRVAGALGLTPDKAAFGPEEQAGERQRLLLNYLTGFKFTNYTNSTSAKVANNERAEAERMLLEDYGFTPEEITDIRKMWKLAREAQEELGE